MSVVTIRSGVLLYPCAGYLTIIEPILASLEKLNMVLLFYFCFSLCVLKITHGLFFYDAGKHYTFYGTANELLQPRCRNIG